MDISLHPHPLSLLRFLLPIPISVFLSLSFTKHQYLFMGFYLLRHSIIICEVRVQFGFFALPSDIREVTGKGGTKYDNDPRPDLSQGYRS